MRQAAPERGDTRSSSLAGATALRVLWSDSGLPSLPSECSQPAGGEARVSVPVCPSDGGEVDAVGELVRRVLRHAQVLVLRDTAPRAVMAEADSHRVWPLPVRRTRVRQPPAGWRDMCLPFFAGVDRARMARSLFHRWTPKPSGLDSVSCGRERRRRPAGHPTNAQEGPDTGPSSPPAVAGQPSL